MNERVLFSKIIKNILNVRYIYDLIQKVFCNAAA